MWRIVDRTKGHILAVLKEHWSGRTANDALERDHGFGAAMDIAQELTYLGFEQHRDFDVEAAQTAALFFNETERLQQSATS
jgi:hypothetical protein